MRGGDAEETGRAVRDSASGGLVLGVSIWTKVDEFVDDHEIGTELTSSNQNECGAGVDDSGGARQDSRTVVVDGLVDTPVV